MDGRKDGRTEGRTHTHTDGGHSYVPLFAPQMAGDNKRVLDVTSAERLSVPRCVYLDPGDIPNLL